MKVIFPVIIAILISAASQAQQSSCDYKVEILLDGNEFESQDFKWRMRATKIEGKPANITGTAEIEDESGKTVKSYKPWTSDSISKQKTSNEYSPNLKPGEYDITAEISVDCDINKENNVDRKEIIIKGIKEESRKKEEKMSTKETGITQPKAAKAEKTPEEETFQASKPKPKKQPVEEFDNVIELRQSSQKDSTGKITANAVQNPQIETAYESGSEKAKGLVMIFLLTLSVLLNIVLIWRR